jgi:hypothetical protein
MRHFKQTYQQVIALFLLLIVVLSSMSFTIDGHYCNGELQNISILGKAPECQMANQEITKEVYCPVHKKMMTMPTSDEDINDCCENKTVFVDAEDDLKDQSLNYVKIQQLQQFSIAYILVFHSEIITDRQSIQEYSYQSPFIVRDIYALSEVFLL